jgi:hypothetical protein
VRAGILDFFPQDFGAGVLSLPSHKATIQESTRPTIIKELQACLGMVNFYKRFLPPIARTLQPLTDELWGSKKEPEKLEWLAAMDAAFTDATQALLSATHQAHPTVGAELSVVVDASATHVGACLQQQLPGKKDWQPLVFFSKMLEASQQKYSAFDRELFTCYSGIRHFRYMLDGRRLDIFMDHKPLTYALVQVSDPWTAHQSRQLSYVVEYMSDVCHIVKVANLGVDTLSRLPEHACAERPPLAATCVKAPSRSQVAALQGGKQKSSSPSFPGMAAGLQPAAGISFPRMAANQVNQSFGINIVIWVEMLSSGIKCYHLELILSSGANIIMLDQNVNTWDDMLSSGANVVIWSKCYFVG